MKTPAWLLVPALLGLACGEGPVEPAAPEAVLAQTAAVSSTVFSGTVVDASGAPLANARVTVNGILRLTSSTGAYAVSVTESKTGYVFDVRKDGYAPLNELKLAGQLSQRHVLRAAYLVKLEAQREAQVRDPSSGITVKVPAGSLYTAAGVAATGSVSLSIAAHGPNSMPGDWTARNASGAAVALETVGALTLSAVDSAGNTLVLGPGKVLDVQLPVPAAVGGQMPACVLTGACRAAAWRFEPKTGQWIEPGPSAVSAQFNTSSTSLKIVGIRKSGAVDPADGLGTWNADIEHYNPACSIIEFSNLPLDCYNPPPAASVEPGLELGFQQAQSNGTLYSKSQLVRSSTAFTVLYNLRGGTNLDLSVEFPPGAPAWCGANLSLTSVPGAAAGYPVYWSTGGRTRFNSGALTFVGYPKNSAGANIGLVDVVSGDHPCGSHVVITTHP